MKITVNVPAELHGLIEDALQSGEYASAEQIALDGLWMWADAVEGGFEDPDPEQAADEDLLAAMEAKAKDKG
jgi:hypothetical protein